jgi:peroxiredoxin
MMIVFGMILPWILLAIGCWLGYQLLRQNGRILLRLENLQAQLGQLRTGLVPEAPAPPSGLPLGSPAPAFELPDLAGGRQSLAQFRGRDVLLVFFNPQCGFCTKMAPALAGLRPEGGDGQPVPLVVTTGDAEVNRRLFSEHSIRCPVLLQNQMEIASQLHRYKVRSEQLRQLWCRLPTESRGSDALLQRRLLRPGPAMLPERGKRARMYHCLQRRVLSPGFCVLPDSGDKPVPLRQFSYRR